MIFSSLIFIFKFLPITLGLYYLVPIKYKTFILTLCSLFFYAWGEPKYLVIMLSSIMVNYICGILLDKSQNSKVKRITIIVLNITFNIGMLFIFKYMNFIIGGVNSVFELGLNTVDITLPLGISFYTFQTMSYTIDVYLNKVKAEYKLFNFSAYVCLFPQLIAGPIVTYSDVARDLKKPKINMGNISNGIELFIIGLSKKVLLANNIGMLWDEISTGSLDSLSTPLAWIGIVAFSLQIYYDFSGYSTMAIGLGKMLGFNFPTNFNFPYISRSITEFWRRWHITLGSWFREYLYIPLGGNRRGRVRNILNLLVVWALTGFWHGADYNFILWGLYFFMIITLEKKYLMKFLEKNRVISHIYTIILLIIGWVIFALPSISSILTYLNKMFIINLGDLSYLYYLRNYIVILIVCILFSTKIGVHIETILKKNEIIYNLLLLVVFIIAVCYLVDSTYNPFLYFRF